MFRPHLNVLGPEMEDTFGSSLKRRYQRLSHAVSVHMLSPKRWSGDRISDSTRTTGSFPTKTRCLEEDSGI